MLHRGQIAWLVAAVAALVALAGCGSSGSSSSSGSTSSARSNERLIPATVPSPAQSSALLPRSMVQGSYSVCPSGYPYEVQASGFLAPDVQICRSADGRSIQAKNISKLVLGFRPTGTARTYWTARADDPASFADRLAANAVWPVAFPAGWYRLPAGATLYASSAAPVGLWFFIDGSDTVRANLARAAGAWIQARVIPREAGLVAQVQGCASSTAQLTSGQQQQSDAIRSALGLQNCKSLVDTVLAEDGESTAKESSAFGEFMAWAKRIAGGSWDDELAGAAEVIIKR
jgi:hypothetical protein